MKIKRLTKPIINPSPYPITCIGIINNSNGIILIFFFEKEPKIESKNKGKKKMENIRIIENAILSAGSAPNGANLQPWHFVIIKDKKIKKKIRISAEKEEVEFYQKRAPKEWLEALEPLGTNKNKLFSINLCGWYSAITFFVCTKLV